MPRSKIAKTNIAPLGGRPRAADVIVEDLRRQIASGEIPHGARLPAERDLAARYGVSGPTVREALQGLNAMGLLDVRHGSGTYVSALADSLVAKSLGTVIELQGVSIANIMGLLGALNGYSGALAIERATDDDIAALEGVIDGLSSATSIGAFVALIKDFVCGLAAAARDPLLLSIVSFLVDVQLELAQSHAYPLEHWESVVGQLQPDRIALVEALKRRDAGEFAARRDAFHARATMLIAGAHGASAELDDRLAGILGRLAAFKRR